MGGGGDRVSGALAGATGCACATTASVVAARQAERTSETMPRRMDLRASLLLSRASSLQPKVPTKSQPGTHNPLAIRSVRRPAGALAPPDPIRTVARCRRLHYLLCGAYLRS